MIEDENGFLYPAIDANKCVECELCLKSCAYQHFQEKDSLGISYAAVAKDREVVRCSSSGGVFSSLAAEVLRKNGVVFGCSMDHYEQTIAMHIGVDSLAELHRLQGSKYVQSMMGNIYHEVKAVVAEDKIVLFSGTPCQVAGLQGFFHGRMPDNLFTVDIICHGVPSQRMFGEYLQNLGKKHGGIVSEFSFRDKSSGWGCHGKAVISSNKKRTVFFNPKLSSYYWLFLKSEIYRDNCYSCPYAGTKRTGDLTLGDYWGIQQEHPELMKENGGDLSEKDGISCVIVNREKGAFFLEEYGGEVLRFDSILGKVTRLNMQLQRPSVCSSHRDKILKSYRAKGYKGVEAYYRRMLGLRYWVWKLRYSKRKILSEIIN
jgi:coenzyme F420-reducing hydrogenase beta subunit